MKQKKKQIFDVNYTQKKKKNIALKKKRCAVLRNILFLSLFQKIEKATTLETH